jgi:glycosyltransferase involved in cell wall biosynthesis
LHHPERTRGEIRRDYPTLARQHAHRADHIIVVSEFTAGQVQEHLGVARDRISVCSSGAPDWQPRAGAPSDGYVLFFGTLEPRKNVGALLDAYERLAARRRDLPKLVLAGQATDEAKPWLDRLQRSPLRKHVEHRGYIESTNRRALYEGAALLVQPSFDEGFGLPVLEAMTLGIPVVASNAGALPEVLGDAGPLVDPRQPDEIAAAIERVIDDSAYAAEMRARGLRRAATYRWDRTAGMVQHAYERAIEHRR